MIISKNDKDIGQTDLIKMHIAGCSPSCSLTIPICSHTPQILETRNLKHVRCKIHLKKYVPMGKPNCCSEKHTPEGSPQQFYLCIDYRKLNSLLLTVTPATCTKKGTFTPTPLPKINDLFTLLKGAKYFTALDLHSGYYHIKLDEEFIPKSAFTTVFGKFKFLRLPSGLSQGQDFFIYLIYDLLRLDKTSDQGQGFGYLAYLDDIQIYSRTKKEYLQLLDKAFICYASTRPNSKLN